MTDIYQLGISVDSTDVVDAKGDLDSFSSSADRASGEVDELTSKTKKGAAPAKRLGKNVNDLGNNTKDMGRKAGQAGIQVQQLVGQVQGGVSPFVALSQQAADFGFVLGAPMTGVIVSLGAVLVGTLVAALSGSKDALKELVEEIDVFGKSFESVSAQMRAIAAENVKVQIEEQEKALSKLNDEYDNQSAKLLEIRGLYRDRTVLVEDEATATNDLSLDLQALDAVRDSEVNKLDELIERYQILTGQKSAESEADIRAAAKKASTLQDQINLRRFSGQDEIEVLRQVDEEQEKLRIQDLESRRTYFDMQRAQREESSVSEIAAIEQYWGRVEELRQQDNMLNAASLQEQLNQRRGTMDDLTDDIIGANKYAEEAESKKNDNLLKINQGFNSLFSDMMESQSKEIFEIGKVGAATKAVTDAYGSINATLAQGGAFAWPAAIATGAAAFANVAKIMSTSYGQTSGSAGSAPSIPDAESASSTDTSTSSQTTINIAGEATQSVVDQLKDLFASDAVIISRGSAQARELNYG